MSRARSCLLLCAVASAAMAQSGGTAALQQHIEAAQRAQAAQDCSTAAKEYASAVRLLPSSGQLRTNMGIALYCDGRYEETIATLQKALHLEPSLAVPHLFLGLAYFHLSDASSAINELKTTVRLMPADGTANLWLGYAYVANRQNEEAVACFNTVLKAQPRNVDARYALGQSYFEIGRQKTLELLRLQPKGRGIHLLLAQQQAVRHEGAGMESGDVSMPWASPEEEKLYHEALTAEQNAQIALQQVLESAPQSDRAHEIQGDVYSLQRNSEAAIAEYEKVIEINPALPGTRLALANCLMQMGHFNEALAALQQEQQLSPRSADVWGATGRVQLALGKDAEATESLKKAVALPGASPAVEMLLGKSLLRSGDAKGSLPYLQKALKEGADPSTTNYLLARAYRETGDRTAMARSLEDYRRSSVDATERRAAMVLTQNPAALETAMSPQETWEVSTMSAQPNSNAASQ